MSSNSRVNTYISGNQEQPDIAIGSLGNFVITWQSYGQDGDENGIFARVYNDSDSPQSSDFQVNTTTSNDQTGPAIALDSNSNFVITWTSDQSTSGSGQDIYAQRFNANGDRIGAEFKVNLSTLQDQSNPDVGMDGSGNFVVVYESEGQDNNTNGVDTSGTGIFGQLFNKNGAIVGKEFRINTYTDNDQSAPVVAVNAQGEFVVVWVSQGQDGAGTGIFGQRYNNAGQTIGAEFEVNTETEGNQLNPAVAIDNNGDFVVAWQSDDGSQDKSGYGIYARRYDSNGNPQQDQFLVNSTTKRDQIEPAVAVDAASGDFTVVWASDQDGGDYGIFGQQFLNNADKTGDEFQISEDSNDDQTWPTLGLSSTSGFIAAWQKASDGNNEDIFLSTSAVINTIRGTSGDDNLVGTGEADRILGRQGNDALQGSGGSDVLEGGPGNDNLYGGKGNDNLQGGNNNDTLDGGDGNDTLTGGNGSDIFALKDKQGSTQITDFQDGTDLLNLDNDIDSADVKPEADGDNTILRWKGRTLATLIGVTEDQISDEDYVYDSVPAPPGEKIRGTKKADNLSGTNGSDTIKGLEGNDTLNGKGGDDTLEGDGGKDTLKGGDGSDVLDGSDGNDTLNGGDANDTLSGGNGTDTLNGNAGDDTLDGGSGKDTLNGGGGNDTLDGGDGNDTINGQGGDDTLNGGAGTDKMAGGGGNDTYEVDNSSDQVIESADSGIDEVLASVTYTLSNNVEKLTLTGSTAINGTGNKSDNEITGNNLNNVLDGDSGNDVIKGSSSTSSRSSDQLFGGDGNDLLTTYNGNDTLNGGNGDDILNGGSGRDQLTAGNGNDQLTGGAGSDTFILGQKTGTTVIKDFEDGVDRFSLQGINSNQLSFVQQEGTNNTAILFNGQQVLAIVENVLPSNLTFPADFA